MPRIFSQILSLLVLAGAGLYLTYRYWMGLGSGFDPGDVQLGPVLRFLLGNLLQLGLLWGLAHLNYRFVFRPTRRAEAGPWYWAALGGWALLLFSLLEWRSRFEPEYADENAALTLWLLLLMQGYAFTAAYIDGRRTEQLLNQEKTAAELQALRSHIRPHFLFNVLNLAFNSAQRSGDESTAQLILDISELLRFTLVEARREQTELERELNFLEQYLRLQSERLPMESRQGLKIAIDWDGQAATIAPLLLLPLVENAFLYGVTLEEAMLIDLHLQIREGQLDFQLRNRIAPRRSSRGGAGTGIAQLRRRLQLLYPNRHQLSIASDEGFFNVRLKLDLT